MELLDIKQDYVFKLIFGDERNKKILIALLNAILKGHPHIDDIQIQNPEIPKILKDNRGIVLDIKAKINNSDEYCDIEMQAHSYADIVDRGIQYLASMLDRYIKRPKTVEEAKKSWSYKQPQVIGIWIMGECLEEDLGGAVNEAVMTFRPNEMHEYQIASEKMRLFIIELPKFKPTKQRHKDMLEDWLTFFKNPLNANNVENKDVQQAYELLKEVSANDSTRELSEAREKGILSEISASTLSREKGLAEGLVEGEKIGIEKGEKIGIEKGEKIGIEKGKLDVVKNALSLGLPIEQISALTGFSPEEIEQLK